MSDLLKNVRRNIGSRRLLAPGQRVLVAVSGGLDSMVLLDVLCHLRAAGQWKLTVAHLNHRLRGRSSDADERLVRKVVRANRVPVVVERADVRAVAGAKGISIEMAARKVRHEFLARVARKRGIGTIALAHHADDQVELFFLRVMRGAGGEGIAGMKWHGASPADPKIQLVRPLLDSPKTALAEYAREHKVQFREDATNRSLDIKRNRIRHELLPLIQKKYQPAIVTTVARLAEIVGADAECVTELAREWLEAPRKDFANLPVAVQRRALHLQLLEQGISPQYEFVEKLRTEPERAICLPRTGDSNAPVTVRRDLRGVVYLDIPQRANFSSETKTVWLKKAGKGEVSFDGATIQWSVMTPRDTKLPRFRAGLEFFDAGNVGETVVLRHWQPGDRFQPIGMPHSVKVQDVLVNQKVPKAIRHRLIVATTRSGEVFWVEGLRISERFKLSAGTKRRLLWRWQRA